ncbi:hypothetical protein ACJMK2_009954 [Sinanodonta woodiana]|uniref:Glutathione S-transferase omega n=1 Tax=Sinanodonta woodiana TaxID=1069815 RepID=A0ABD3VFE3_SINWO
MTFRQRLFSLWSNQLRQAEKYSTMTTQKAHVQGSQFVELAPGTLRLYSMRFCPYAQRTRLVLEHKRIPYETVNIHLRKKPDWFLQRNPIGLVPVLEKDDKIVYESSVCNDYLDDVYPQNKLNPTDPYLKARDRQLYETFSNVTSLFMKIAVTHGDNPKVIQRFLKELDRYEAELKKRGKFFGGEKVCMVDFMIWPWFERLPLLNQVLPETRLTQDRFPSLLAWTREMYLLPAVKSTMYDFKTHRAFMDGVRDGNPDYDYGLADSASSKL